MADIKAEYVDHVGSDLRVVNAARVSFAKEAAEFADKDGKLLSYLAKHDHWTPFAHCMITLRETVPIFVARQRFKHTVGFVYNEESRRYVDNKPEFYFPKEWRGRPVNAKQGSSDEVITMLKPDKWFMSSSPSAAVKDAVMHSLRIYEWLIESDVAPEQARMVLPQSMMTSYYVTGSLAAFARAYKQRSDSHAQSEIRDLAVLWDDLIKPLFPVSWSALVE